MRLFNDYSDRKDYFVRGAWLPTNAVPYRDVMSEYPQIPTFLFGILYLPFLNQADQTSTFFEYSILFAFVMLCLLVCLAMMLDRMLSGNKRGLVLTLLLPAPLYFAYNRFDVLPGLIVIFALWVVSKGRWEAAAILLAIGTLTKWYPALLVVPVTRYMLSKKIPAIRIGLFLALFGLTSLAILSPTYLAGGVKAVLSPYVRYSNERGFDMAALPALVEPFIRHLFTFPTEAARQWAFLILQLSVLPIVVFAHVDSFEQLLSWCLLAISVFMLFSRIYSPQWLLWILPFMILLARDAMDTAVIISYGTVTYLEYPILHVGFGINPLAMMLLGWMNIALLAWIIIRARRRLASIPQAA